MPDDNYTLFSANFTIGDFFYAEEDQREKNVISALAFIGGLGRAIFLIFNTLVAFIAERLFMINILDQLFLLKNETKEKEKPQDLVPVKSK